MAESIRSYSHPVVGWTARTLLHEIHSFLVSYSEYSSRISPPYVLATVPHRPNEHLRIYHSNYCRRFRRRGIYVLSLRLRSTACEHIPGD